MIKFLLILVLSGAKLHWAASEPKELADKVKYKGPVIYSNLPPPVLYFPNFPEKQEISSRGDGETKQIEYVPFPYKDLPVLVYQSDNQPPVHVVEKSPNKEKSKETNLKTTGIQPASVSHSSNGQYQVLQSKPLSNSQDMTKEQQVTPTQTYQQYPHIQNQQFISIGISAAHEPVPQLSAYNSNSFGKQTTETEQGKNVQAYQLKKEHSYDPKQISSPQYSSQQSESYILQPQVQQANKPQHAQYSGRSYLKQNSSEPYSQIASQQAGNKIIGHQYTHTPTTDYQAVQVLPQHYSQSHSQVYSGELNYQGPSTSSADQMVQKMNGQDHSGPVQHAWQHNNAPQMNQMIRNQNVLSQPVVSANNYNVLPPIKQQMMYQPNIENQENSQQHLGISIHVPSPEQSALPKDSSQQEKQPSVESNEGKEFDIDGHQYVSIGFYPVNVPDDGYNNGVQYYNILIPQNEGKDQDQSQNGVNLAEMSHQKDPPRELNQLQNPGYQMEHMNNLPITPTNAHQQGNTFQKANHVTFMQENVNSDNKQNGNQQQLYQRQKQQQVLLHRPQQQNMQLGGNPSEKEENSAEYQQILIHIPHEVVAQPQVSIFQDEKTETRPQGDRNAHISTLQHNNNPYIMAYTGNEKPIVPKMRQPQTSSNNFGGIPLHNYASIQSELNSANVPKNPIFLFSNNRKTPVEIVQSASSFIKPAQFGNYPIENAAITHRQPGAAASTLYSPKAPKIPFGQAFRPFEKIFFRNNPEMFSGSRIHYHSVKPPFMSYRNFYPTPFSDPFLQMSSSRLRPIYAPSPRRSPLINIARQDHNVESSDDSNIFSTSRNPRNPVNEKNERIDRFLHAINGKTLPLVDSFLSNAPALAFFSVHAGGPQVLSEDENKFKAMFQHPSQAGNQGISKHESFIQKLAKISNAFLSQSQIMKSQLTSQEDWKLIQNAALQQIEELLSPKQLKENSKALNETSKASSETQEASRRSTKVKETANPPIIVYKGSKPPIEVYGSKKDIENPQTENVSQSTSSAKNPSLSRRQDKDPRLEYLKLIYSFLSNISSYSSTKRNEEDSSEETSVDQIWLPEDNTQNTTRNLGEIISKETEPQASFKAENAEISWLPDYFPSKSISSVNEDIQELLTLLHKEEKSDIVGH